MPNHEMTSLLPTLTLRNGFLAVMCIVIGVSCVYGGWQWGIIIGLLPLLLFVGIKLMINPIRLLGMIFIINYIIMGIGRYAPTLQGGLIIDGLILTLLFSLFLFQPKSSRRTPSLNNLLTWSTLIWMIYCLLQIANPEAQSVAAWYTGVRGLAIYFFLFTILPQLLFTEKRQIEQFLFIWAILIVLAVGKALLQKFIGFDSAEQRWLFVDGFARTHIIQSGIRYFSFFTDAANFGAGMAYSMVAFTFIGLAQKRSWKKPFYLIVALLAGYGMMISGTRTAMIIPFVGYTCYAIFSKQFKIVLTLTILLGAAYLFFAQTNLLNGNATIRRMRSAFHAQTDASYLVRKENQKKMKIYMADRHFGVGIGLSGGKAKRYKPYAYMSQIPTDSWFVMVWAETGIVGLWLHILTLIAALGGGVRIVMTRIRDPQMRMILGGILGGIIGMVIASSNNEIFGQLPNNLTLFIPLALIYLYPQLEKNEMEKRENEPIPTKK